MIEILRIRQLAIVDQVDLELGPGLNVITGETGAGKSLILGALGLLAGGRASADLVRAGAEAAEVEAVLRTEGLPELEAELERRGLACEDHALVARRTLSASGRSRAQLAGQLVPVSVLREILGERIEISSQHESQGLLRPESHGRLLDAHGGLLVLRDAVARGAGALAECDRAIERLRGESEEQVRRQDYLAFQVREIDEAKLVPGEIPRLGAERSRLLHAERLGQDASSAAALIAGDPALSDARGAGDLLAEATRLLDGLARLDENLAPLARQLAGAHAEASDVATELERYAGTIEGDPERLSELDARLERIEALRRKYGASVEEILAFRDDAATELGQIDSAGERLAALEDERGRLLEALSADAKKLSAGRVKAARKLARAVVKELRELSLPHADFEVGLDPAAVGEAATAPCGPGGLEVPEFRFRANPGEPPRSLRRVASGGELSRVFLALKNVLRRADAGLVLVFDEVDAGIGGRVADRVGRAVAELATDHQVLCITHLPQVAALGDVHWRVEKIEVEGRAVARVSRLEGAARVEEIARMAGGERVSEATRRHARDLLSARQSR